MTQESVERRYRPWREAASVSASVASLIYGYVYLSTFIWQERVFLEAESAFDAFLFLSSFAAVLVVSIVLVTALAHALVTALGRLSGRDSARTLVTVASMAASAAAVVAVNFFLYGNGLLFPGSVLLPTMAALGVLVAIRVDVVARMKLIPMVAAGFLAATAFTLLAATMTSDDWALFLSYDWPVYVIAAIGALIFTITLAFLVLVVMGLVARRLSPMSQSLIGAIVVGAFWVVQLGYLGDGAMPSAAIVGIAAAMGFFVGSAIPARSRG